MMKAEVKKGFKLTELGLIPNEWDVKKLSEVSRIVRGGSPRPAGDPKYFNGSYIPWLTVASLTNIPDSQINVNETAGFLTKEGSNFSRKLEIDTPIIANSGFSLGIAKILKISCCANDGIAALLETDINIDWEFVTYYLNTLTQHLRKVVAIGNDQPNLNIERIGNIFIPVPPTKAEQTAIAKTIKDADALITSLEKIIEKKQRIKQGAMQKMLTPKKSWKLKKLGEIILRKPKTTHQSSFGLSQGKYPFFTNSGNDRIEKYFNDFDFDDEVIIANTGGAAYFKYFNGKFATMSDCYIFSTNENTKYIYYFLKTIEKSVNESGFTGSGIKHLDKDYFNLIDISIPSSETQTAIVAILSDMEGEIDGLEKKLQKYKMIKQGMMQNLLTGKIRLV